MQSQKIIENNKTQIQLVAQKLFSEKGYRNTSIRDIADLAGTNCSMINYHFISKENLYIEIIEGLWPILNRLTVKNVTDTVSALKNFVFKSVEEACKNSQLLQLCLENRVFPISAKSDQILRTMSDQHYDHFKVLAEEVGLGQIRMLYTSIFALVIDVLILNKKQSGHKLPDRSVVEELLEYINVKLLKY